MFRASLVITVGLTFCAIITKSSKFMYLISSSSASVWQFVHLLSLLMAGVVSNIFPIALALSISIVMFRFQASNQLVALRALGFPINDTIFSIFQLSVISFCSLLVLNLYIAPACLQEFKTYEAELVNNVSFPRHSGNLLNHRGISVFAEKYSGGINFKNLIITDLRNDEKIIRTYKAEAGSFNKKVLQLTNGEITEFNQKNGCLLTTKFEKHSYDFSELFAKYKINYRVHEMSTSELVGSSDLAYRAEFHSRILNALIAVLLALVAFFMSLSGEYNRQLSLYPLLKSVVSVVCFDGICLGLLNACQKNSIFIIISYCFVLGSIFGKLFCINKFLKR